MKTTFPLRAGFQEITRRNQERRARTLAALPRVKKLQGEDITVRENGDVVLNIFFYTTEQIEAAAK